MLTALASLELPWKLALAVVYGVVAIAGWWWFIRPRTQPMQKGLRKV